MSYQFDTSGVAYDLAKKTLTEKQRIVLKVIEKFPNGICDKHIAKVLNWPINCITNRRGELVQLGKITESHKATYDGGRVAVTHWKIKHQSNNQSELF